MRFFFDTEFYEDGKTIDLISIGCVASNGAEFYAESGSFRWSRVPDGHWLHENVYQHLWHVNPDKTPYNLWSRTPGNEGGLMLKHRIKPTFYHWVLEQLPRADRPEFWAYYADYDWVVLCQLFGTMMDLPPEFPRYCRDLKQLQDHYDIESLPAQETTEHNALNDARWLKYAWETVMDQTGGLGR